MEEFQRQLETDTLRALAHGEVDAEFRVLDILAKAVLHGLEIGADFQEVANLVVAKSLVQGKLPSQRKGRRKGRTGVNGHAIAEHYLELKKGGAKYESAVSLLAATYHKDERQIMRIVQDNRGTVDIWKTLRQCLKPLPDALAELNKAWESIMSHRFKASDEATEVVIGQIDRRQKEILHRKFGTDKK